MKLKPNFFSPSVLSSSLLRKLKLEGVNIVWKLSPRKLSFFKRNHYDAFLTWNTLNN